MQDDVIKVAQLLMDMDGDGRGYEEKARAAMAATREIDAEAMSNTLLPATWNRHDCADWLQQRANQVKEAGNG